MCTQPSLESSHVGSPGGTQALKNQDIQGLIRLQPQAGEEAMPAFASGKETLVSKQCIYLSWRKAPGRLIPPCTDPSLTKRRRFACCLKNFRLALEMDLQTLQQFLFHANLTVKIRVQGHNETRRNHWKKMSSIHYAQFAAAALKIDEPRSGEELFSPTRGCKPVNP